MATVVGIETTYRASEEVAVMRAAPITAETLTSTGASQQAAASIGDTKAYWVITTKDGAIWAAFGANPTAVAGTHHLIPAGSTRVFNGVVGHKCAIIDA